MPFSGSWPSLLTIAYQAYKKEYRDANDRRENTARDPAQYETEGAIVDRGVSP